MSKIPLEELRKELELYESDINNDNFANKEEKQFLIEIHEKLLAEYEERLIRSKLGMNPADIDSQQSRISSTLQERRRKHKEATEKLHKDMQAIKESQMDKNCIIL